MQQLPLVSSVARLVANPEANLETNSAANSAANLVANSVANSVGFLEVISVAISMLTRLAISSVAEWWPPAGKARPEPEP